MIEQYKILDTENIDSEQLDGFEYNDPLFWPSFQDDWVRFKKLIKDCKNCVIMRIYDGELLFLERKRIGNIPKRHCNQDLQKKDLTLFYNGVNQVDYLCMQLNDRFMKKYMSMFSRKIDFPMEFCYSIVTSRWIFKEFPDNEIALIGGSEKMKLIQELMKYEEYRNYLGIKNFNSYISIPERFASNDPEKLLEELKPQIENSRAKVFLFGMGISKLAVAYKFKDFNKNAIFIDVGCGISALAGFTSINRPYHGSWINYRIKNYNLKSIDQMDSDNRNVKFL